MLTAPDGVGARSQQPLLEVARTQHLALPEGDVPEVLAGRTALVTFEGFKVSVINKAPLLQAFLYKYVCTTPGQSGLATGRLRWAVITTGPRKLWPSA